MIDYYPYDATAPHRPSLDDLGGDEKLDDGTSGPGDPRGAEWNNFARLHAAAARMLPIARLTIYFDGGGNPVIEAATSMRTTVAPGDFVITDNGVGDVTISWAAGLLPPVTHRPCGYAHGVHGVNVNATRPSALSVRVYVANLGAPADAPFTVDIF